MWFQTIPKDTNILKPAMPRFYEGGDHALLLLHGYTGYPGELDYIAQHLHEKGYTISIPRLPGHGTNHGDFLSTTDEDWLRHSIESYLELRSHYQYVDVIGFSMGAAIALILASCFSVSKLAVIAPPLKIRDWRTKLIPFFSFIFPKIENPYDPDTKDKDLRALAEEYWNWYYPESVAHFLKIQKQAKKILPHVHSDTLIIVSKRDNTVPFTISQVIERKICSKNTKSIVLEKSPHLMINDKEKDIIVDELYEWFR